MPHEFLLHSDWRTYRVYPNPIGVPKSVRADVTNTRVLGGTV
jgi:hypothetical protein